jgi:hypothetical protein
MGAGKSFNAVPVPLDQSLLLAPGPTLEVSLAQEGIFPRREFLMKDELDGPATVGIACDHPGLMSSQSSFEIVRMTHIV